MYDFLTGPALWATFIIFVGGLVIRIVYLVGLSRGKDPVIYNHISLKWGFRSIFHWIIPFASASMRNQPFFVFGAFIFHIVLILVPIFFSAHIFLWEEAFGISLLSFPDILSDIMTLALIGSGLFLLLRRIIRTEVRILTGVWDYVLLLLTIFPFITGFLAFHQFGPYKTMVLLHIISGEILLIIIPFSKLAHVILFFFTRTFIGFEMGARRGARSW